MRRPKIRDDVGFLYFVRSLTLDVVKVGFAVNPDGRLPSLQTGNHHQLYMGTTVPIEFDAERAFHDLMKPHRVSREWYPDDDLVTIIEGELIEAWGDKVQEANGGSFEAWVTDGDERANPLGVYITAKETVQVATNCINTYFNAPDETWGNEPLDKITNHWLPQPKPRTRKLRAGYH